MKQNSIAALARHFSKLNRLSAALLTKRLKAKPDEVDKDPDKEKLSYALNRREKEVAELDNQFKCVSLSERLQKITIEKDGKVVSHFETKEGKKRTFKDMDTYKKFVSNKTHRYLNSLKHRLTPMQLYVTQDCGNEKPFSGSTWYSKTRGIYCCVVCKQRTFM